MYHNVLGVVLPLLGSIALNGYLLSVFLLCLFAVVCFEFVNGFHDTANAVATVIYTKALKPVYAIPWSGLWNFLGVALGGVTVAMGILKLVPLDTLMTLPVAVGACMVISVLLGAIIWNIGTWYLGIPCSSSHTMIGAMIGAGLAFTIRYHGPGVNWSKAGEIGSSLVLSPIIGFAAAALLMLFLKHVTKSHALFHIPKGENDRPPIHIRLMLITTCTLVSFFHGSNDGQKGVGLFMLILIAFLPARFAVNHNITSDKILSQLNASRRIIQIHLQGDGENKPVFTELATAIDQTEASLLKKSETNVSATYQYRKQVESVIKNLRSTVADKGALLSDAEKDTLNKSAGELQHVVDFAPVWVIGIISLSLGLGTMVGWKRIVVTIGERIGNEHLNYAQGATSEIVAASTIGLSTWFGLPVSTTHVLSSGIAGSMLASGGTKNLNNSTLKSIAVAWVLTLPAAMLLSFLLFQLFHLFV
ncbi:inorganic phosphate transporter [Mucilaginibacter ximonensis]|uniref:Phosphate transporter n=1 Tax=Mucilaginibacter ximonensis TaxID=538021 RepID=A0ABW5Y7D6_9SPHI